MVKRTQVDHGPESAEGVPVRTSEARPVGEFDAQLESGLRVPDEIRFIDVEEPQQVDDGRYGGLTDADGTYIWGFDDGDDAAGSRQGARQNTCGHPAGGAASDDCDAFYLRIVW
jgi:hypothetical protein